MFRLMCRSSAAKKLPEAGSELGGAAVRGVPYSCQPQRRLGEAADRHDAPARRELVQERARCCYFRRGRSAIGCGLAEMVRMRGHDVPEQDVLLEPKLGKNTMDDRRARLGRACPCQLALRGEGEPADPRAAIARGLTDEQHRRVGARLQVSG